MNNSFYKAIEARRSIYSIDKTPVVPDDKLMETIQFSVKHTPSAFNSQSARVLVLFRNEHDKLWDIVMEALRKIVPADTFHQTEQKINGFKNGYGTVLFFEDSQVIKEMQQEYALYKDNFPIWSQHSTGMLQFVVWTALEMEGLGASLQHYGPLIEQQVKETWDIPAHWDLIAQLPFGNPTEPAGDKEFDPLEKRVSFKG